MVNEDSSHHSCKSTTTPHERTTGADEGPRPESSTKQAQEVGVDNGNVDKDHIHDLITSPSQPPGTFNSSVVSRIDARGPSLISRLKALLQRQSSTNLPQRSRSKKPLPSSPSPATPLTLSTVKSASTQPLIQPGAASDQPSTTRAQVTSGSIAGPMPESARLEADVSSELAYMRDKYDAIHRRELESYEMRLKSSRQVIQHLKDTIEEYKRICEYHRSSFDDLLAHNKVQFAWYVDQLKDERKQQELAELRDAHAALLSRYDKLAVRHQEEVASIREAHVAEQTRCVKLMAHYGRRLEACRDN